MNTNIGEVFPGFRAKQPPSEDPQLGRELIDGVPSPNSCFTGQQQTTTQGDKKIEHHLSSRNSAELSAGVAKLFGGKIGGEFSKTVDIVLENLSVSTLDTVFFDPRSTCAQRPDFITESKAEGGLLLRLVTGAVKAGRLIVASGRNSEFTVDVNGLKLGPVTVGADYEYEGQKAQAWEGEGVYFTERIQCFKVALIDKQETVGLNNAVDLGSCSFTVAGLDPNGDWLGRFSCDQQETVDVPGRAGELKSGQLGRGVSYRVRAGQGEGLGMAKVEIRYWLTYPVSCPKEP